jgi:hypothetical protein
MKKLSNMMLAAVAAAAIATPAMAWDFGATGSATATFNQTTTKATKDATALTEMGFGSEGGAITMTSSNVDGDNSVKLSYMLDWDGNLDEVWTISGTTKSGNWTATASVDYNNDDAAQTGEDRPSISLSDGSMTIVMGNAAHLSTANNTADGVAGGAVNMGFSDAAIGAFVDDFQGVSVGIKVDDNTNVTVAYQSEQDDTMLGRVSAHTTQSDYTASGFGLNVSANVGATIGFTFASASTKENSSDNSSIGSAAMSTMGLSVGMAMDGLSPFLSYGSSSQDDKPATGDATKTSVTALGLGATITLEGSDTAVVSYTTSTQKTETGSTVSRNATATGIELGYNTTVGPVSLGVGYGSTSVKANEDGTTWNIDGTERADGYTMTDIEVKMGYSF